MHLATEGEENDAAVDDENIIIAGKGGKGNKAGKNKKRKQSATDNDIDDKENFLSGMEASSSSSLNVMIDENPFLPISKTSRIVTASSRGSEGEVEDASAMPPPTKGNSKSKGKSASAAKMTGKNALALQPHPIPCIASPLQPSLGIC